MELNHWFVQGAMKLLKLVITATEKVVISSVNAVMKICTNTITSNSNQGEIMRQSTNSWNQEKVNAFNKEQKDNAIAEINGGSRSVPCEKIRKTAPHCPDGFMQQTCHTISQVQNFFQ